jgi:hypothetical protein
MSAVELPNFFPLNSPDRDADCLHCVMAQHIRTFVEAHPDKAPAQVLGEILQIAAEYAASTFPECMQDKALVDAPELLVRLMRESFAGALG